MSGRTGNLANHGPVYIANFDKAMIDAVEDSSDVQQAILDVTKDKGWFLNEAVLIATHPTGVNGDNAKTGTPDALWLWDSDGSAWVNSGVAGSVTSVDSKTGAVDGRYTQAIFFGKGGLDTNDGKSYIQRKLTLAAAKTAASALTPASGNQIVLVCEDAGTYTENYSNVAYVHIHAPAAILVGTITVAENCQISFGNLQGNLTVNTGKILYSNILNHSSGTNTLTGTAKVRGQIGDEIFIKKVNFIA